MSVLLALIPLALLLALGAVLAFIWAVRSGQLDDLDTPALRVLLDDERPRPHPSAQANANTHQETHHR